jgi:hypothetical protein
VSANGIQTPDIGLAIPIPLDKLDGCSEFYGVKVAAVGEDGEEIAAFTHDRRRAVAAANRYVREVWLMKLRSIDVRTMRVDGGSMKPEQWWIAIDSCGCGDTCPHPKDEDGWSDCNCKTYGLPPCLEEEMTWIGRLVPEGTPAAFPVLLFEVTA